VVGFERILKFLFDSHVHYGAYRELKRRVADVEHVLDVGLGGAPDEAIMAYATRHGSIVATRDYHDFVRLLDAYVSHGRHHPGLLLLSKSVAQRDAGAHVRSLLQWIQRAPAGENPLRGSYDWLAP
jgi:predicted nuclease of predicted toxin-antitoxin system